MFYVCLRRYEVELSAAKKSGVRKGTVNGSLLGVIFFLMFEVYALVEKKFMFSKYEKIRLSSNRAFGMEQNWLKMNLRPIRSVLFLL